MHPFCCVSVVSDHSSPITLDMPPIPAAPRSDPAHRPGQALHSVTNGGESGRAHPLPVPAVVDVRIKDLVGNGISGILHKWVNYGKGWRTRWFVLQDGVLSYYKIHGPDKIIVNSETEKGSKVIGEESARLISRNRNSNHVDRRRKPIGEIHLKVSFIICFFFLFSSICIFPLLISVQFELRLWESTSYEIENSEVVITEPLHVCI